MATPLETILNIGKNIVKTGKQAVTSLYDNGLIGVTGFMPSKPQVFDPSSKLGIAENTIKGLPQAVVDVGNIIKEFLVSNRGYDLMSPIDYMNRTIAAKTPAEKEIVRQEYKAQQPTFKESVTTPFRYGAEMASGLGNLIGPAIANRPFVGEGSLAAKFGVTTKTGTEIANTKFGSKLADAGANVEDYAIPKTAGEAQAMKMADILSLIPMGSAKAVTKAKPFAEFLAKDQNIFKEIVRVLDQKETIPEKVIAYSKEALKKYGYNVPKSDKALLDVIKNAVNSSEEKQLFASADNALNKTFTTSKDRAIIAEQKMKQDLYSIKSDAQAIVKDGKKVVTEQPRDKIGRFDVKPKLTLSEELMSKMNKGKGGQEAFGAVAGVEVDENGNVKFDPLKAAIGFAGMTAFNRMKKIMPVDRLIAEGKIKINRVGTRDVYSYKKGNMWQRARDESSAIRAVTKEPKVKPSLPDNLVEKKIAIEIQKEAIQNNPLNGLIKYVAKTGENKGRLPEVLGNATSKGFGKRGDDIIQSTLGRNIDSETARQELETFMARKQQVLAQERAVNEEIKAFKTAKAEMQAKKVPQQTQTKIPSAPPLMQGSEAETRSMEKIALGADRLAVSEPLSLPKIIEQTVTPVKAKVNTFDTYLRTPNRVMEKIGFGSEAKELRGAMDEYWKELRPNLDKVRNWESRVSPDANKRIFRYLDGEAIDLVPKEREVAIEIKTWLQDWANRLNLPADNRISHYITHIFDKEIIGKEFPEEMAKLIADKVPGSVYDPFLLKRLGAKGYKQDTWEALDAYIKRGTRKVHMDPVLEKIKAKTGSSLEMSNIEESQYRFVQNYVEAINKRPTINEKGLDNFIRTIFDSKFVKAIYNKAPWLPSVGQRPTASITGLFRRATSRAMLGLNPGSALRNLSQGINTYAVLGEKHTVVGYVSLFKKGAMKELKESGVLNAGFIEDRVLSSGKRAIQNIDKVLYSFFEGAERVNRGAAYFGAKAKALNEGKSIDEAVKYAKEIVRKTQFSFDVVDAPVAMNSNIVKTLLQFQTFSVKQIEFLTEMAYKDKNFAGLLRYALAGTVFVYTVGKAFGMEPKELLPLWRFDTPPSLKVPVEATKMAFGVDNELKKTSIGLVPAGSQIKKTYQGAKSIQEGGVFDRANRLQFEGPQTKAQQIQAILFGKYASQKAKDYFNKADGKELEKIRPVYDQVQKLKEAGDIAGGQAVVDSLTDEEYELYKKVKSSETSKKNAEIKKSMYPVYNQVQKLKTAGNIEEAQKIIDSLTDDEYKAYQSIKKDNDSKPVEKKYDQNIVSRYAEAVVKDPSNALKALFTKEKLGNVEGNLVELQRFYGIPFNDVGGSQEYKKKRMIEMGLDWDTEKENYKLEHIVPVSAGGSNADSNLVPVNNTEHEMYTPVDIAIGEAVKQGKITRKRATELSRALKVTKILSVNDIINLLE